MGKKNGNWSKKKAESSMNKQGYTEDKKDHQPKSQLEQRAKKKNTKI